MKQVFYSLIAFLCLSSTSVFSKEYNVLNVTLNQQTYKFERPVRLASVLSIVANQDDWYWPASAVYNLNAVAAEQEREAIKAEISALLPLIERHSDKYSALGHLYRQVSSWKLATRIPMPVSYDKARLFFTDNPMFQFGDYSIQLKRRPEVIHFLGAIRRPGAYKHQGETPVYKMVEDVKTHIHADQSFVYVIDPKGNIEKRGVAYWNLDASQLMPGSQVYVPITSELFSDRIEKLNERVAALAVNRLLP